MAAAEELSSMVGVKRACQDLSILIYQGGAGKKGKRVFTGASFDTAQRNLALFL